MELILLRPFQKPYFMGMLFDKFEKAHIQKILDHRKDTFTVFVTLNGGCADTRLIGNGSDCFHMYDPAKCSMTELQGWARGLDSFNFGHLVGTKEKYELYKTETGVNLFVKVNRIIIEYG